MSHSEGDIALSPEGKPTCTLPPGAPVKASAERQPFFMEGKKHPQPDFSAAEDAAVESFLMGGEDAEGMDCEAVQALAAITPHLGLASRSAAMSVSVAPVSLALCFAPVKRSKLVSWKGAEDRRGVRKGGREASSCARLFSLSLFSTCRPQLWTPLMMHRVQSISII